MGKMSKIETKQRLIQDNDEIIIKLETLSKYYGKFQAVKGVDLGAQDYNCGQVFQGLALILFSGGLFVYYMGDKWKDGLLKVGQFAGFLVGIGLIMNGIYSEDFGQPHYDWSLVIFISIILMEFIVNAVLLKNPKFKKSIAYYGFIAGTINLLFMIILSMTVFFIQESFYFLMEYIAIYTFEIWLGFVVINIFKNEVLSKD